MLSKNQVTKVTKVVKYPSILQVRMTEDILRMLELLKDYHQASSISHLVRLLIIQAYKAATTNMSKEVA